MNFSNFYFLSLVILIGLMTGCSTAADMAKPNIVFILTDDLGYGDIKQNNRQCKNLSPAIDSIADAGMNFTDMHAPGSTCIPSRYGLMTGTYPFRYRKNWRNQAVIEPTEMTLPKMLKENGYVTCMIGKWHLGFDTGMDFNADVLSGGPYDRGFDEFYGLPHSLDIEPYLYIKNNKAVMKPTVNVADRGPSNPHWTRIQGEFWRQGKMAANFDHNTVLDVLTDRSAAKIRSHAKSSDKPLFLYVPLTAPHTPWLPGKRFMKDSKIGLYGAFVAHVDDCVKRIDQAIQDSGMGDNTIFIISSDNGPVWYEKDKDKFGHSSTGVMRGMKGDLWEGGHRVPFIVRWPARIKAGSSSDELAGFVDMIPTFADIVGDKTYGGKFNDGYSLASAFTGGKSAREKMIHSAAKGRVALRSKDWKYIPFLGSGGFSEPRFVKAKKGKGAGQLYNLANDPAEQKNLYEQHPALVKQFEAEISQARKR